MWNFNLNQFLQGRYVIPLFLFLLFASSPQPIFSLGTYAEGMAVVQLNRMEESGLMYSSYEGEFIIASYDKTESCDAKNHKCYTPNAVRMKFSARPEDRKLIGFLKDNEGKEMLIKYKIHRITPVALGTSFELIAAFPWKKNPPHKKTAFGIGKSGNKRSFDIYGRILRFDYRGTMIGTWEGLYLDSKRRKVHSFTVTDKRMADYIFKAMLGRRQFFMAISQSYVATMRDSDYDIFAIDYMKAPR